MIANADNDNSIHKRREWLWCGSRSSGIFWGLLLMALGLIWIGKKTGFIPLDMSLFWPSVMVIMGIWMLAAAVLRRNRSS